MMKFGNVHKSNGCELDHCLREPLRLCRWAGFFPLEPLRESSISSRRFLKLSYLLIHFASLTLQTITTGFTIFWFFINAFNLETLTYSIFYLTVLIGIVLLRKLALIWTFVIKKALDIEKSLSELRRSTSTLWRYSLITYIVMLLALIEHLMSIVSRMAKVMSDLNETKITDKVLELYFTRSVPFIFNMTTYNSWKAVPFLIANVQATFIWNITDVMTMCISLYLTSYFGDLNKIIKDNEKIKTVSWGKIRMYYSDLVALVKEVDARFCYLVLLSFFTNLFFISLQLFNTLNYGIPKRVHRGRKDFIYSLHSTMHMTYYIYSFMFLTVRACVMCLLAADVHVAAQEPLHTIRYVPSSDYTLDLQRFTRQLRYTTTALSGVYFYVTRGTLLKVAGTIFTYELVLLQFNMVTYEGANNTRIDL